MVRILAIGVKEREKVAFGGEEGVRSMRIAPVAEIKAQLSAFIKASEESPVVVTKNGKPVAVLIGTSDEDDIERLILAHSKKLRAVLEAAEIRIQATGGIPHDDFWRQVDAEYDDVPGGPSGSSRRDDLHYHYLVTRSKKGRKRAYLKGRNMTVGQLIYTMRANDLSDEEAAVGFRLASGAGARGPGLLPGKSGTGGG